MKNTLKIIFAAGIVAISTAAGAWDLRGRTPEARIAVPPDSTPLATIQRLLQQPRTLPSQVFRVKGNLSGTINGESFRSQKLDGLGKVNGGEVLGLTEFDEMPKSFDVKFLQAFQFSAAELVARPLKTTVNPFEYGNRVLQPRHLKFIGSNDELRADASYTYDANRGLEIHVNVTGTAPKVALETMEPAIEMWIPGDSPGNIGGIYIFCWRTKDNRYIYATAETSCRIEVANGRPPEFSSPEVRYLTFQQRVDGNRFLFSEEMTLFRDFPDHTPFLKELLPYLNLESGR